MRDKAELTKEEKHRERAHRKRSIKTHLHHKEIGRKEKNREKGLALVGDRFMVKQLQQKIDKKKKGEKTDKERGEGATEASNSNKYKSGKFFSRLNDISQQDKDKKESKKRFRETGKADSATLHTNQSAKKFKM